GNNKYTFYIYDRTSSDGLNDVPTVTVNPYSTNIVPIKSLPGIWSSFTIEGKNYKKSDVVEISVRSKKADKMSIIEATQKGLYTHSIFSVKSDKSDEVNEKVNIQATPID